MWNTSFTLARLSSRLSAVEEPSKHTAQATSYFLFGIFRNTKLRKGLDDSVPLMLIAKYSLWNDIAGAFLRVVQSRSYFCAAAAQRSSEIPASYPPWPVDDNYALVWWVALCGRFYLSS